MKVILPNFHDAKVLVIGDTMLDCYWYGHANRISPEAPVPIVKINSIKKCSGGAANVAINIAALGSCSHLISITGIDDTAHTIRKILSSYNVTFDFIQINTYSTIIKLRILSHNHQLIRLDFEQDLKDVDYTLIMNKIKFLLPKFNVLVLSDYAKGVLKEIHKIIELAHSINIPILIDPKGNNFNNYKGATLLTPNLSEFEAVVGTCKNEDILVNRGMSIIDDYKLSALLITRSEDGMTLLQPNKKPLHLLTKTKEVYDVTGAGDTVIGVLAASLSAGNNLEESCFLANIAAGISVRKLGTSTVSIIELTNAIREYMDIKYGIVNERNLKKAIFMAHQRGEKIVMTNGVFDILHAGHVTYLSNARKLGDRLIVAVNSDASVKKLKGEHRPINNLLQRMLVLAGLKSVDWVVSFNEDTPKRLISYLLPDLLVKGGDYKLQDIAGKDEVFKYGGDVKILNFEKGYSTTEIIKNKKI